MESKPMEQAILEVTSSWDYEAVKKFHKFWQNRTNLTRFVVAGGLSALFAVLFAVFTVFTQIWLLLLIPLAFFGFAAFCFLQYRRLKPGAIELEKPTLQERAANWAPLLLGAFIGLILSTSKIGDLIGDISLYIFFSFIAMLFVAFIIALRKVKKDFKQAIESTCAFYESYLFMSYTALEILVQKGIPYSVCLAQETQDAFYLQYPTEPNTGRNSLRLANTNYDNAILDKQQLTDEQQQALRELFARTFGEKFKQYNQK